MLDRRAMLVLIALVVPCASRGLAAEAISPAKGTNESETGIVWYDLRLLDIEGRGWTDTKAFYDRLPAKAEAIVRPDVWRLSRQTSGLCARFVSDATTIHANWTVDLPKLAETQMPATAVSGLDLYVKHEGRWRWLAVGMPLQHTNQIKLVADAPPGEREYLLYLPLYNVVSSIELGLPQGGKLAKADPHSRKPIVFYGTSITQGGCASRPGMVYTAILGRRLGYPVINLGFRSNGTMDPEMARLFVELDPAVYVLDCLPNLLAPEVRERVEPFVATLRAAHPATPILLVEDRSYTNGFMYPARRQRNVDSRIELKAAYERLLQKGVPHLHYLAGEHLWGDDGEASNDSSHPTDLGSFRQANAFEAALRPLLSNTD